MVTEQTIDPDIKYSTKCKNQKLVINARNNEIDKYTVGDALSVKQDHH